MVNVNSHDGGWQCGQVLSIAVAVRREGAGTVSGTDVEEAVGAKFQASTVVPTGQPADHRGFGFGVNRRWVGVADGKSRHHRPIGVAGFPDVRDVTVTVLFELRVKGQAIDLGQPFDGWSKVNGQVGGLG